MDMREFRYQQDWPSRVLAIFSLILASLALGYVVLQGQFAVTQEAMVKQFDQRLQDQLAQRQPEWTALVSDLRQSQESYKDNNSKELDKFLADANDRIQQAVADALADRQEKYQTLVAQQDKRLQTMEESIHRVTTARPAVPADSAVAQGAAAQSAGGQGSGSQAAAGQQPAAASGDGIAPATATEPVVLDVEPTTYDAELVVVNRGTKPVSIDRLHFVPTDFLSTGKLVMEPTPATATSLTFATTDNSSASSGDHGVYDMRLPSPMTLQPGDRVMLRVGIDNAKHQGWALVGDLTLMQGQTKLGRLSRLAAPFSLR
ncbi:MAG: hypothetical protein U0795_16965 [Pirellulales bacterium]